MGTKRAAGSSTSTHGIFILLIDLERPQRGGFCGFGMLGVKETCIDCHGVLITYPVAKRGDVEGVEVNLCVLGRCLLSAGKDKLTLGGRGHYKNGARSLPGTLSCMASTV